MGDQFHRLRISPSEPVASAPVVAVLVIYLIALLLIGLWGRRESGSIAGYYVAGKKLPYWVVAFSSNATGESAWLLLGVTGMGYVMGIHALWIVFGEVLGVSLMWVLVGRPFKEYTDRYNAITVPDYLESRFRDARHIIRLLSVVIIVVMVTWYTSAQLIAAGKAFSSFLGTSYSAGVIIGTVVVLYYTSVGGFKAVAYTDVLQGILMLGGFVVLPIVGIAAAGGWIPLMSHLEQLNPALLTPMGAYGLSAAGIASAVSFAAIGMGYLGAPQLLVRFISARSREEIVPGSLIAIICMIVFGIGAVFSGMAGRALFPNLADPESVLPMMSSELFPAVFTGIFLVTILAAIMSTVDSLLILASSAVVRDVVQVFVQPNRPGRRLSLYGKVATVVIGAGALTLALSGTRMIFWFVAFAWSGLSSAFGPPILCSIFWKRTTLAGAVSGMTAGFVTSVIWMFQFKERFSDLYELIPGLLIGFLVTILVSVFTSAPAGAATEQADVWRTVGSPFGGRPPGTG